MPIDNEILQRLARNDKTLTVLNLRIKQLTDVQKQEFENLQKELKKLKEGFEQAGISSGGNQVQLQSSGNAFGVGVATAEQRRLAELEQQVRLLTTHVLSPQEPPSPLQSPTEDNSSYRQKLFN